MLTKSDSLLSVGALYMLIIVSWIAWKLGIRK